MRIILNYIDNNPIKGGYWDFKTPGSFMNLNELRIGETGRIVAVQPGDQYYRQRLLAMGLLPGTEFKIERVAPLGDPIEIAVRGYALSLRLDEASILQVEKV